MAASFGSGIDPVYEVAVAAPMRGFDLLLVRATAVLATTTLLAGAAALTVPHADWGMAAWLLPAFALTAASLALSTWVAPWKAAAALGSVWVAAAVAGVRLAAGDRPGGPLVERFVAFRPSGQAALAAELEEGSDFRYAVHQAAGMVSVQLGVSITVALIRLRAYAFAQNRRLTEVAEDVVARRLRME